jgi:hypothetical protein
MATTLLPRLRSPEVEERIAATYELDRTDFASPEVLDAVRINLSSANADLIEISTMRLSIRGDDTHSIDRIIAILESTPDDLVFSAAVFGLSSLARKFPDTAARTISVLENLQRSQLPSDKLKLVNEQLAELS